MFGRAFAEPETRGADRQLQAHAGAPGSSSFRAIPATARRALFDRLGTREEVLHFDLPVGALPLP
ncbi:hypothetical protein [Methylorubrum sp. Q1]|uniref:hypothetical protein n=1 Tax=Methylorubrum sp. Q1 TaxID=2562453 RepID=UPI001FDF72DD|nr:hypothetical protein [Methylorubrum sp. Q1]